MTTHDHALGIHHVTAIAGDPQRNVDFYAGTLGLRMVKRTVNFDDPTTYHFYYGDETGTPGSIVTFFPWPGARAGRAGAGQVTVTSLAIPPGAVAYWLERLVQQGVAFTGPTSRFDERVLSFKDPDGMVVELVAHAATAARPGWSGGPVPAEAAVRGVHSVTLWVDGGDPTARVLVDTLGFREVARDAGTTRYEVGEGGPGSYVDMRDVGGFLRGVGGTGTVHHVAFRTAGDEPQTRIAGRAAETGLQVTTMRDRQYFHSHYFREPGGVLFELATDVPGFLIDEPLSTLGEALKLPPQYEPQRAEIERALLPIHLPSSVGARP